MGCPAEKGGNYEKNPSVRQTLKYIIDLFGIIFRKLWH